MSTAIWFLLVGAVFLFVGLTASWLKRLPFTPAVVYLAIGVVVGPTVLEAVHFNPLEESKLLELVAEGAVLLSLFTAGMKMPVPVSLARWRTPIVLALLAMALTVGTMTAFGFYILGLPLGAAVLLGAILAPTDPVLATEVQVRHPGDRDRLRFGLTCEAGMNDGSAFPFVMLGLGLLGLHDLGNSGVRWLLLDVAWATAAGIALGVAGGVALGRVVWVLRRNSDGNHLMDDFLGLGLIGVVYGLSLLIHAWGFLAVFFAAVALRQTEMKLTGRPPDRQRLQTTETETGEALVGEVEPPIKVSDASLVFKEQLERLSEVVLILILGGTLFVDSWSWRAVTTALFLFVLARPFSVAVGLLGSRTPWRMRAMIGWFGLRGIGSLYYLMYAIEHGLPEPLALELLHLTLIVVTLSIIVHGISVKPVMGRFWQREDGQPMRHGR